MEFGELFVSVMRIVFLAAVLYSVMILVAAKFPSISQSGTMLVISVLALVVTFTFSAFMRSGTGY